MGCDIHCVIQVRKDNEWKSIQEGFKDRNYQVFTILAGVRPDLTIKKRFLSHGLPYDFEITPDCYHIVPQEFEVWIYSYEHDDYLQKIKEDCCRTCKHVKEKRIFYMGDDTYSNLKAEQIVNYPWDDIKWDFNEPHDVTYMRERLNKLLIQYGKNSVRIVFGFDS